MEKQSNYQKRRRARWRRQIDAGLSEVLLADPPHWALLMSAVETLCKRVEPRVGVRQPHHALLGAFEALEDTQEEALCRGVTDEAVLGLLSAGMRMVIDSELAFPDLDVWNRFVSLYHAWVAVRATPATLQEPLVRAWIAARVREALTIGQHFLDAAINQIPRLANEPQTTFNRIVRLCEAVLDHNLVEDSERAWVEELADRCRNTNVAHSQFDECEKLCSELIGMASTPGFKPGACEDVLRRALAIASKKELFGVFQVLSDLRSRQNEDRDAVHALSEVMFAISSTLCGFPVVETNLLGAFHDRYALYDSVRLDKEMLARAEVLEAVKKALREAYELGCRVVADPAARERLMQSEPSVIGHFYSRLGEICRVHPDYDLCTGEELQAVLERGVESLRTASEVTKLNDPRHAAFNLPRLADCLRSLGRLEDATAALGPLFERAQEIEPKVLWDAHRTAGDVFVARAWRVRQDEPQTVAGLLSQAEAHCLAAARVWEPERDPRLLANEHPNNMLIHSMLAWVYFNGRDWQAAVKQAEFFLAAQEKLDLSGDKINFTARTAFVLAQSLVELGNLGGAAAAIRKLLDYGPEPPEPRFRILPLATLLRIQKQLGEPQEAIDLTFAHFLQVCQNEGVQIPREHLNEDLLQILTSPDAVGMSLRRAQALLDAGRVKEVLEMLPIMVTASRISGQEDPALLTLLAEADREAGKFEDALRTLKHVAVLDSGWKNQSIVWRELGNVHEAVGDYGEALKAFQRSYQRFGFHPSALVGCCRCLRQLGRAHEAVELMGLHTASDGVWPGIVIREMARLLNEPSAEDALLSAVSGTTNSWFVELIQRAAPVDVAVPASVMHAVRRRLYQPNLSRDIQRGLLKLCSRDLARCYFAAPAGGQEFEQLVQTLVSDAISGGADLQRSWIFSLLTSCRDAVLLGTLQRYVEATRLILSPLLEDSAGAGSGGSWQACLSEMNDLLLNRMPERLQPSCYAGSDSLDVRRSIESLFEGIRAKLGMYLWRYGRRFDYTVQEGPLYAQAIDWLSVAASIKRVFDFDKGPLAGLISDTDDWQIELEAKSGSVAARFSMEMASDVSRLKTEGLLGKLDGFGLVGVVADISCFPNVKLEFSVRLQATRPLTLSPQLAAFFQYLGEMDARAVEGGGADPDFFKEADRLFPSAEDEAFLATPAEWSRLIRHRYDQQFASTVLWLAESPRGPNRILHDLKGQVRGWMEAADPSGSVYKIELLRENVRQTFSRLVRFTLRQTGENRPSCDLVGIARRLIRERRESVPAVEIMETYTHEPLVAVHPLPVRLILSSLLDNAVLSVSQSGCGKVDIIVRHVARDSSAAEALIIVANPYDPRAPEDQHGTGLGRRTARNLVSDNGGRYAEDPDAARQKWTTRVWLPTTA